MNKPANEFEADATSARLASRRAAVEVLTWPQIGGKQPILVLIMVRVPIRKRVI